MRWPNFILWLVYIIAHCTAVLVWLGPFSANAKANGAPAQEAYSERLSSRNNILTISSDTLRQVEFNPPPQLLHGELIPLRLVVRRRLNFDLDAYYYREQLYLPVNSLSSLLKLKIFYQQPELTIFFPDPEESVHFQLDQQVLTTPEASITYSPTDVFQVSNEVYILSNLLESVLGLSLDFNYRKLSIYLDSPHVLPVLSVLNRKERYVNFVPPDAGMIPDVQLPARHYLFNGWTADWSVNSSHSLVNHSSSYQLGLGGQLLGGELSLFGSGSTQHGLRGDQLKGQWRIPVYSTPVIRQVQAGNLLHHQKIGLGTNAFKGLSISNRSLTPRRIFSQYTYEGALADGDLELYINNRLHHYALSEQTSRYRFSVPMDYGSNLIQLKYYGLNGALSRQREFVVHIPQEFLPPGKVEYTFSAGTYTTAAGYNFGQINLQWGVSPYLTLGGGSTFTGSEFGSQVLPFVQSQVRLGNRIIATGSHTYSQWTQATLSSSLWGTKSLALQVQKHHNASLHNLTGKSLEASLNTSFPVTFPSVHFSPFIRTRYTRYHTGNQTTHLNSGFITQLPLNIRWRMNSRLMNYSASSYTNTQLELETQFSRRVLRNLLLRPGLAYNYQLKKVSNMQLQLNTRIASGYHLEFLYQRNNLVRNNQLLLSFRMNLPFARHYSTIRSTAESANIHQYTSGSIGFHDRGQNMSFNNQRRSGRAELMLRGFLDLNNNSQQDPGEPTIEDMTGDLYRKGEYQPFFRGQHVFENLTPYGEYLVLVNAEALNNPLWVPAYSSYSVQVLPNMFTKISVPVLVAGEISGQIEPEGTHRSPLHGIQIHLYSADNKFIETLTTYRGGKFYYVGLKPGTYKAVINREQLEAMQLTIEDDTLPFTIKAMEKGDIVEGLTFKVAPSLGQTSSIRQ